MKLGQIVNAVQGLNYINKMELPLKEIFNVQNLLFKLESPLNNYNIQRNKLLAQYGKTKDNMVYTDLQPEYYEKLEELLNIDVEMEFEKIAITQFDIENTNNRCTNEAWKNMSFFIDAEEKTCL